MKVSGENNPNASLQYQEIKHNLNRIGPILTLSKKPNQLQYQQIVINRISLQDHNSQPRSNLLSNQISALNQHSNNHSASNFEKHSVSNFEKHSANNFGKQSNCVMDILCSNPVSAIHSHPRRPPDMQVSLPFIDSNPDINNKQPFSDSNPDLPNTQTSFGSQKQKTHLFQSPNHPESRKTPKDGSHQESSSLKEELFRICPEPGMMRHGDSQTDSEYLENQSNKFVKLVLQQNDHTRSLGADSGNYQCIDPVLSESDKTHLKKNSTIHVLDYIRLYYSLHPN